MKKVILSLAFVLLTFIPFSCSEDQALKSLDNVNLGQDALALVRVDLELKLKYDLKLQKRVFEIQNQITPELFSGIELEKILGRAILKNRGVDPNFAFPGGLDDPRLALVPVMTDFLDSLNEEMSRDGLHIDSVAWMSEEEYLASQSVQISNGNSISLSQNIGFWSKVFDCFDQGAVFTVFGGLLAGVGAAQISGATVVAGINGLGAIGLVAAGYYAYRVGECHRELRLSSSYGVEDDSRQQRCLDHIRNNPGFINDFDGFFKLKGNKSEAYQCILKRRRQMAAAYRNFKEQYGDTLRLAANYNH